MVPPIKRKIGPSLGDIDRGIKSGTRKVDLYRDLSAIAAETDGNDIISEAVKKGLREEAEKISESGGSGRRK